MSEQGQGQAGGRAHEQETPDRPEQAARQREAEEQAARQREAEEQVRAKARLVFGDPLDRQSRDDTDSGWGDRPGAGSGRGLDWYLSQRPPHHGD
ncbi:hypothetical protein AB0C76_22180 [Kitasatospora sp. NPDC048722]|uniref:hypothetical protein n=1 Tax=Kitasatospora sp. NPDC048722 TaxID=3155639 RepID=UPI0033CA2A95